jgi:hypothetical protein
MKKNLMPVAAVVMMLALLGAGCSSPLQQLGSTTDIPMEDGKGAIRVSLGNSARTILPNTTGLYYVLAFTSDSLPEESAVIVSGESSVTKSLGTGSWDLEVKGYLSQAVYQADATDYGLYGTEDDIGITAGQQTTITVALVSTDQGQGKLVFDLSFPGEVTTATLEFDKLLDSGGDQSPVNLLDGSYLSGDATKQSQGDVTLSSGYYRITARLVITESGKTRRVVKGMTAHIKDSLQTAMVETFEAGDFRDYFTTVAGLTTWLTAQPNNTATTPYSVALELAMSDLVSGSHGLAGLFNSSYPANKYIDLDLSACAGTMSGTGSNSNTSRNYLVSVILPDTVTSLPNNAFTNFTNLRSATIPGLTGGQGSNMFSGCSSLESFVLPEGVTYLLAGAFQNCTSLADLTLPSTFESFTATTFNGTTNIQSLTLPSSTTGALSSGMITYFAQALRGNPNLIFTVTGDTSGVGYRVWDNGKILVRADAEDKITIVAARSFPGTLVIDTTVKVIGNYAFSQNTALTTVDASGASALATIEPNAFSETTGLATLDISGTAITTTLSNALGPAVKTLKLPVSLTGSVSTLPASLEQLEFPEDLAAACFPSGSAFQNCANLAGFTVNAGNGAANYSVSGDNKTLFNSDKTTLIASVDPAALIPAGVTGIADYAFYKKTLGGTVSIPANVTRIGNYAFAGGSITALDLNAATALDAIGNYAFQNCAGITGTLDLSANSVLKSIGDYAFAGTGITETLAIPATITSIGNYAFSNTAITSVDLSAASNLETCGTYVFSGCTAINSMDLSGIAKLTSIPGAMFNGCTGITALPAIPTHITTIDNAFAGTGITGTLVIPAHITAIGNSAFSGMTGITSLTLPDGLASIGSNAFQNCTGLTTPTLPGSLASIGTSAFNGCTGIITLTLPNSLASIGTSAFSGCTGLSWVKWPASAVGATIGGGSASNAPFRNCSNLTRVELPDNLASIGNYAFNGCSNVSLYVLNGTTPPTVAAATFVGKTSSPAYLIYVPDAEVDAYKAASVWSANYASKVTAFSSLADQPASWQ